MHPIEADTDRAENEIGLLNRQPPRVGEEMGAERDPQGCDRADDGEPRDHRLPTPRAKPSPERGSRPDPKPRRSHLVY
jgi:hypothetical protein